MSRGFVYALTNDYMDGLVKIGCTDRSPHQRAEELSSATGVPVPFRVLCYIEVEDAQYVERHFHRVLDANRVNQNREFFRAGSIYKVAGLFYWYEESLAFSAPSWFEPLFNVFMKELPNPWMPTEEEQAAAQAAAEVERIQISSAAGS